MFRVRSTKKHMMISLAVIVAGLFFSLRYTDLESDSVLTSIVCPFLGFIFGGLLIIWLWKQPDTGVDTFSVDSSGGSSCGGDGGSGGCGD